MSARLRPSIWGGAWRAARDLAAPAAVAVALAGIALVVAVTWQFDAGTGPELQPNFELGPLGRDRSVQRTARSPVRALVGVQLLSRAIGTIDPVAVTVDAYAGPVRLATTTVRVFPNERLQRVRVAFATPIDAPALRLDLRMQAGSSGAVIYGATRGDERPPGELALDGRVEFADQDLTLRTVHRTTAWTALLALAEQGPMGPAVAAATTAAAATLAALALLSAVGGARAALRAHTQRARG